MVFLNYTSGNHPYSQTKKFTIDTTPPKISIKPIYKIQSFAPESENRKTIKFKQIVRGKGNEEFVGIIYNQNSEEVYFINYKNKVPNLFEWDGKNKNNQILKKMNNLIMFSVIILFLSFTVLILNYWGFKL